MRVRKHEKQSAERHRRLTRCVSETLESRVFLSGSHDPSLITALDSVFTPGNSTGLSGFNTRLTDPSALGSNIAVVATGMSNYDPGSALNTLLSGVAANSSSLTALQTALAAKNGIVVSAIRDLPNDLQVDVQFNVTTNVVVPINASFGANFSEPGSVTMAVTLHESLTLGAYWDGQTSSPVTYVNASNDSIQVSGVVTAYTFQNYPAVAQLGFVEFDTPTTPSNPITDQNQTGNKILSTTVSFSPTFTFALNQQPPVNSSEPAGRLTFAQLTTVPVSTLVNTQITQPAPSTLTANITTPLVPGAHQIVFTWSDINTPTDVSSTLDTDPSLMPLNQWQSINPSTLSTGLAEATGDLAAAATTNVGSPNPFDTTLPLINKSINDLANFSTFYNTYLTNFTDATEDALGNVNQPFQTDQTFLSLLQGHNVVGATLHISESASGSQLLFHITMNYSTVTTVPAYLPQLNLSPIPSVQLITEVNTDMTFGIDGSTGLFFVTTLNQPPQVNVQVSASGIDVVPPGHGPTTGYPYPAKLGFLSVDLGGTSLQLNAVGNLQLVDPQSDTIPSPGIITSNELASGPQPSGPALPIPATASLSGTASANIIIGPDAFEFGSALNPSLAPATITISWADVSHPDTTTSNYANLTPYIGFNNLAASSVDSALAQLPTVLNGLADSSQLGRNLAFFGSNLGSTVSLGALFQTNLTAAGLTGTNSYSNLQSVLQRLQSGFGTNNVVLSTTPDGIAISLTVQQQYTSLMSWSASHAVGPAAFQATGSIPVTATYRATLDLGIILTSSANPSNQFYLLGGGASSFTGTLLVNTSINGPATIGSQPVTISNGTIKIGATDAQGNILPGQPATFSIPLGNGSAGQRLPLPQTISNPDSFFGTATFAGAVRAVLPINGLPSPGSNPQIQLDWANFGNPSALVVTPTNLGNLTATTTYLTKPITDGLDSLITLIGKWANSSVLNTNIPFIDKSLGQVIDFTGLTKGAIQQIETAAKTATSAADLDTAIRNVLLGAGITITQTANDNPAGNVFEYTLAISETPNVSVPFSLGGTFDSLFSLSANVMIAANFSANLVFGFDAADGFYIVGGNDPAHPQVTLSGSISANLPQFTAGGFGVIGFGLLNGSASMNLGMALNLVPNGANGNKISTTELSSNALSIIQPTLTGATGALSITLGAHIGGGGPGISTTFTADWDPSRDQAIEFGPTHSADPADGFSAVNLDIGEFITDLVGPVLSQIKKYNPFPQQLIDALNYKIPMIDKTPADILGDYSDNPALGILVKIAGVITDLSNLPTSYQLDMSQFIQGGGGTPGNTGTPDGQDPGSGGGIGSDVYAEFKSFADMLETDYNIKLPALDDPQQSIINTLLGKPVDLVVFDPGQIDLKASYETPEISVPLFSLGIASVNGFFSAGLSAEIFANIDIGLSTRGLLGQGLGGGNNILDGFFIGDTDQYQVGVKLEGHITVGGEVELFDILPVVKLDGQFGPYGEAGIKVNTLVMDSHNNPVPDPLTGLYEIAGYDGNAPGNGRAYLDQIEYIASNYGPLCAVMPGGQFGLQLTINATVGISPFSFSYQFLSQQFPIVNWEYPCVPVAADLADVHGHSLIMNADPTTAGYTISASVQYDTSSGSSVPVGVAIVESNKHDIFYKDIPLSDLVGVDTIILKGSNGDDIFKFDPNLTLLPHPIQYLEIDTNSGNDIADLSGLSQKPAGNSDLLGVTLTGGDGNDTLKGTYAPDVINVGSGKNYVFTGTGNAVVYETSGDDTIDGANGNIIVHAGSGKERILLGDGDDIVYAGSGDENIVLGDGRDLITAGTGKDTIDVGDGNDEIHGDFGGSTITAGAGQDVVYGGPGNDSIKMGGGNDFIDPGTGNDKVDGGSGHTLLSIHSDSNQTLTNDTVTLTGNGKTSFSHITTVSLTGGPGNNIFDVSAWTRNAVQINGGGGTDTIASTNDTNFTLTDSSLQRSDGATFLLSGITNANLTGGASDNTFDLTGWHNSGFIDGNGGDDTLIASNLSGATLTDTLLTRPGAANMTLIAIAQANLTTSPFGNTQINASSYHGSVALFGQGNGNTLIGGAGSDYIVGGTGSNNRLVGNGSVSNQLLGGAGSSDLLFAGPGQNLLVGSAGGHDTITTAGSSHVYTPGANDTINAQTGSAIIYLTGSGNSTNTGASTTDQILHPGDAGTTPSDFIAPPADPWSFPSLPTIPASTLPTGANSQGQWIEYASSASGTGVSNSSAAAIEPSIVVDSSGNEILAWSDNRTGIYEIYVAEHTSTGWSELAGSAHTGGVSNSATDSRRPSITLDSSGNPVVAWTQINGSSTTIHVEEFINGSWVSVGSPLSTGHADNATIVNTTAGLVAAWLDSSSGNANVFVQRFDGSAWNQLGANSSTGQGLSNSAVTIPTYSLATDGSKIAIAWTQPGTAATQSIYLLQYANSTWNPLDNSTSSNGISGNFSAQMPTIAYASNTLYAAWSANTNGRPNIVAASDSGTGWTPVSITTPISAGINQVSRGAASNPVLSSNGAAVDLVWTEDRLSTTPNQAVAIYANRLAGGNFVAQLPGDSSFDGILGRSTSLSSPSGLAIALDPSGHPFVAWSDSSSGSPQIYSLADTLDVHKIIYVNDSQSVTDSFTTAAGAAGNDGLSPDHPLTSIQAALNLPSLQPGDVILVDSGNYSGFTATSADNGVLILGSPTGTTLIKTAVSLNNVQGLTLEGLDLTSTVTITGGSAIALLNDIGGSPSKLATNHGGSLTLSNTTNILLSHNAFASLSLTGATSHITAVYNSFPGAGFTIAGSSSSLLIAHNSLSSISINTPAQGTITANNISGGGLTISALFTGSIDHNLIHDAAVGVTYSIGASLNSNDIFHNKTGILSTVNSNTTGLGFMPNSSPNHIFANGVGVNLTGLMQDQSITANNIGVTGSGVLGGTSLDTANLIQANSTGIKFTGTIQYNRINANNISIAVQNNQLISHNLIYGNAGPNLETQGASSVKIINNTFYSPDQTNIQIDGSSSDVQILNNILQTGAGYDINVADDSRTGFFSDYNDLYTTGSGKIVHYLLDFSDILDWQDNVALFDLHSIGTTVVHPAAAQPQFTNLGFNDFRVFPAAAGLRPTSPTIGTADPNTDLALPVGYSNLLANPSFESGTAGWTVNPGSSTLTTNPLAFDGTNSFFPGSVATGFAQQTLNLLSSYSASQLDAGNLDISFGGRIRSASEALADQGQLLLTFLDASNNPIGTPTLLSALNVNNRWELVGSRVHIPAGARSVTYRFQSPRQTGTTDDSYLDNAFLYVLPNTVSTDIGAFGNTAASLATPVDQSIHLQSPDLYVNWTLNQSHNITWSTFGNTGDTPVKIDLYQIVGGVLTYLQTISPSTADSGSYAWIPQNSNLSYGTYGLVIQVSLVGNPAISDHSTETFTIPENSNSYYINDSSTTNDQYTSAPGSNRATGKLSSAPLPLLTTLLRTYSLGGTDTVNVDTGFYYDFAPVELSGNPAIGNGQGITIQGPTQVSKVATISAIGFTSPAVIDVNTALQVSLSHLTLINADYGLWVRNTSTNFTGSYLTATSNLLGGIRIESDSTSTTLDHLVTSNNHGNGFFAGGPVISLTNSSSFNNTSDGFHLANSAAAVLTNDIAHNNGADGFYIINSTQTNTQFGNANLSLALGNQSYNNAADGIYAQGVITVAGNTVYGQSATNATGINLISSATATQNIVHDNFNGIIASNLSTLSFNRSYNNTNIGIEGDAGATITNNEVYGNYIGIRSVSYPNSSTGPYINNNLLYNNNAPKPAGSTFPSNQGIWLTGGNNAQLFNNTVYQPTGDAIHIDPASGTTASNIHIENNILWTQNGNDISLDPASETGFLSDYNDLYFSASGAAGLWENVAQPSLTAWNAASNNDSNSLSVNPLFVNPAAGDFHVQSNTGSFHGGSIAPILGPNNLPISNPGSLTPDSLESPTIDRGDSSFSYSNEPSTNGGFINLGSFGNTSQASLSPASFILVLKPTLAQNLIAGQSSTLTWRSQNTAGTVNIDLLFNGSEFLSIAAGVPNTGSYLWSLPNSITPNSGYSIQVTRNAAPTAIGTSNSFTIQGPITHFYVNGAASAGTFTTAAGSDANTGLDPAHPKASLQALFAAYQLGAGDTIFVDQATYNLSTNIVLTAANSGLTIQGVPGGSSLLNRTNTSTGTYVFDLQNASNITLQNFTITGGLYGINATYNNGSSTHITISNNDFHGNAQAGINLTNDFSSNTIATNDLISGNVFHDMINVNGTAGVIDNGDQITLSNNTVYNTVSGFSIQAGGGSLLIGNTAHNNYYGFNVANCVLTNNTAYNNTNIGILSSQSSTLTGNVTYNNTFVGINIGGGTATGNISYGNPQGIYTAGTVTINNNLVYNNSSAGIVATNGSLIIGNVLYGNAVGISLSVGPSSAQGGPTVQNNLLYNNIAGGISITGGDHTPILNNTIYQPSGYALQIASSQTTDIQVRDNIFQVATGTAIIVGAAATQNVSIDYNDLYVTGNGQVGQWNGINYSTLSTWQSASAMDTNSLSLDPLFVNPAANDFHLQSLFGSNHGGTLAPLLITGIAVANPGSNSTDSNQSPLIDRGASIDPYSLELNPNGAYVDLGAYGNSSQSSLSPVHYLLVINPASGITIATGQPTKLTWRDEISNTPAGATKSDTIQLLQGANIIQSFSAPDTGSYVWTPSNSIPSGVYKIRITRNDGTSLTNDSANFNIAAFTGTYYVNGSATPGSFTTAAGSDSNSGLDPAHPKATLSAILNSYTLQPGNIIKVDQGTYNLSTNLTLSSADSGITIQGVPNLTILNRNNLTPGAYVFDLAGATNLTLLNLNITGAYYGVNANIQVNSDGLTVTGSNFYANEFVGINLQGFNGSATISNNTFYNNLGPFGLLGFQDNYAGSVTVTGNTVHDMVTGIYVSTQSSTNTVDIINNNTAYNNATGMILIGGLNSTFTANNNVIYDNYNINLSVNASISNMTGNTIYQDGAIGNKESTSEVGVSISNGNFSGNSVYGNVIGINLNSGQFGSLNITNNSIHNNSGNGVSMGNGAFFSGNTIFSNGGWGIQASLGYGSQTTISNNLVYSNNTGGIYVTGSYATDQITNNTVYQPKGDALKIDGNLGVPTGSYYTISLNVENNILWAQAANSYALDISNSAENFLYSNYNDLFSTGSAQPAQMAGHVFSTLSSWIWELGLDANSISADPQFTNIAASDFSLQYSSPTLDAGDPTSPFSSEPSPNGGRINIGHTGNTPNATPSPSRSLQITSPSTYQKLEVSHPYTITFHAAGLPANTTATVELSLNNGSTWTLLATGVSINASGNGSLPWTPAASSNTALLRIIATGVDVGAAVSAQPFIIAPSGVIYYVNDSSTTGDSYTTAIGNNANNGKTPAAPMASIEAVINTYHPGTGATIQVDAGTYILFHDILIPSADSGLTITGPLGAAPALINRNNTTANVYAFSLFDGASNITLSHLSITGADIAINAPYKSNNLGNSNITISNNTLFSNATGAILTGFNNNWLISNNIIHDNSSYSSSYGIYLQSVTGSVTGNTIYNETHYGILFSAPNSTNLAATSDFISNNTVYGTANGIWADHVVVSNNLVHDNTAIGIYADQGTVALNNTVWRQTANGAVGIQVVSGVATGNSVFGNYNGILMLSYGTINANRIYSNTNYGILMQNINGTYGYISPIDAGDAYNNLIYSNSVGGIYLSGSNGYVNLRNNTIYQLIGDAITFTGSSNVSSPNTIQNNVLYVQAGYDIDIASTSQPGLIADYNDLYHVGNNAHVGFWNGAAQHTLASWKSASSQDTHSTESDPLFVDPTGADASLGYNPSANNGNGYNGGPDDNFLLSLGSPAINTGLASVTPATDLLSYTRAHPDLGAYAYRGTTSAPPTVSSVTTSSAPSQLGISRITVNLTQPLNDVDANASSLFSLIGAGPDGNFGTGDDLVYSLTPSYVSGSQQILLTVNNGPLPAGSYRLTILSNSVASLHNLAGIPLDGDSNGTPGGNFVTTFSATSSVLSRSFFYNNSSFDGNNPAVNSSDDNAIATDKQALLPGQTASFANYTSFSSGITGIMFDIASLPTSGLTATDFSFLIGNSSDTSTWNLAPNPSSIIIRPNAGTNGSARVEITWPAGAIKNTWLQITILPNTNTGLSQPDVSYYGNAPAESGNSPTDAAVTTADVLAARGRISANPVTLTSAWDYNRDGVISSADMTLAQQNLTAGAAVLELISTLPPATPGNVQSGDPSSDTVDNTSAPDTDSVTNPSVPDTTDNTTPPDTSTPPAADPVVILSPPITAQPHLVFISVPSSTVAGHTLKSTVIVYAEDASGHLVTTDHSSVKLFIQNPAGAKLLGPTSVKLKNGKAVFSNISIQQAGSYTLDATDSPYTAATSSPLTITPGPAAKLRITRLPSTLSPHTPFTLQVEVTDQYGNLVTTDNTPITLHLASHPKGSSLTGTLSASILDGLATFDNLSLSSPGSYTLLIKHGAKLSKLTSKLTVN